jgi:hypothetical protein
MTPLSSLRGAQRRGNPCAYAKAAVDCFRHCEERSDVAIHVPASRPKWIASFLAMPGQSRSAVAIIPMTPPGRVCFEKTTNIETCTFWPCKSYIFKSFNK